MLVERFEQNPIITPNDVPPSRDDYEVIGAFNAGVTVYKNQTLLLMRVAERPKAKNDTEQIAPILDPATQTIKLFKIPNDHPDVEIPDSRSFYYKGKMFLTSISHLRIARSRDGRNFTIDPAPAVFPQTEYETFGIEDPRISKIGDTFYITYKTVSPHGICTSLLTTCDFENFQRHGIIFCPENIDVVIFPELINGKFYALSRPVPKHIGPFAIWLASSDDAIQWGGHLPLIIPREGFFDAAKVGSSCIPIRTKHGWLEIYHGADENDRYCVAAALLDLNNPSIIIGRSKEPLMRPEAEYEKYGFYSNVVFPCGAITDDNSNVTIYYGASDESIAAAQTTIEKIISTIT